MSFTLSTKGNSFYWQFHGWGCHDKSAAQAQQTADIVIGKGEERKLSKSEGRRLRRWLSKHPPGENGSYIEW